MCALDDGIDPRVGGQSEFISLKSKSYVHVIEMASKKVLR
jgi:hypothetical protein